MFTAESDTNLALYELRSIYRSARRNLMMGVEWPRALRRQRARQIALLLLSVDWTKRLRIIVEFRLLLGDEFADAVRARVFSLTHRTRAPMKAVGLRLKDGRELRAA